MKQNWLAAAFAPILLSGCSGIIYGNGNAPIVNRNVSYGQPADFGGQNTPPGQGAFGGLPNNGPVNQVPPANTGFGTQPLRPPAVEPLQNAPTVANIPPTIQVPNQTQVQAANPYRPAAPTIASPPAPVPGWEPPVNQPKTAPLQPQAPGVAAVKEAVKEAPDATVADPAANNRRQALRPNIASEPATAPTTDPSPAESKTVASAQPAVPAKAEGETAVSALLKKASGSLGKGDLDGAAAYLENAQRLDPKNSKILYDIANIRYHQGRYKEAESMASRAVQTGGSNGMLKKSWSLISNSRNKLGDSQGAVQAATKAASY